MSKPLLIGIDPGVNTGYAILGNGKLTCVSSLRAVDAEVCVKLIHDKGNGIHVYVEDTRKLRLPAALQTRNAFKGLGSVHRDMQRWEEFLLYHGIPHTMCGLSPKPFRVENAEWFRWITGYSERTNEHGRAAAGLIWGR